MVGAGDSGRAIGLGSVGLIDWRTSLAIRFEDRRNLADSRFLVRRPARLDPKSCILRIWLYGWQFSILDFSSWNLKYWTFSILEFQTWGLKIFNIELQTWSLEIFNNGLSKLRIDPFSILTLPKLQCWSLTSTLKFRKSIIENFQYFQYFNISIWNWIFQYFNISIFQSRTRFSIIDFQTQSLTTFSIFSIFQYFEVAI